MAIHTVHDVYAHGFPNMGQLYTVFVSCHLDSQIPTLKIRSKDTQKLLRGIFLKMSISYI